MQNIDSWLASLAKKRDDNQPLHDGTLITRDPRIMTNAFKRTGRLGQQDIVKEYKNGVSLTGDGKAERFLLEAVIPVEGIQGAEIITVQGSDPIARAVRGSEYTPAAKIETIAAFDLRTEALGTDQYFGFGILGNGNVVRTYLSLQGVNVKENITRTEDMSLAHMAFDQIKTSVR